MRTVSLLVSAYIIVTDYINFPAAIFNISESGNHFVVRDYVMLFFECHALGFL